LKTTLIRTLKFTIFLAIGILLLYYSFKGVDFKSFAEVLGHTNYYWIAISLIFMWISVIIRAHRWNLLIETFHTKPSTWDSYHAVMVGYIANYAFPRMGEVTRCAMLFKTNKISVDKLIGSVIVERVIDLLTLLFLAILVFFIRIDTFGAFFSDKIFKPIFNGINASNALSLIITSIILLIIALSIWFLRNKIKQHTIIQRSKSFFIGIAKGLKSFVLVKNKPEFIFYTIAMWVCYWLSTWLLVLSLPATAQLGLIDALFILTIGSLGMSVPVQGGIGAYHAIVSLGLLLFGLTREEGLAFAIISHESQMIGIILLGCVSLAYIYVVSHRKKSNNNLIK